MSQAFELLLKAGPVHPRLLSEFETDLLRLVSYPHMAEVKALIQHYSPEAVDKKISYLPIGGKRRTDPTKPSKAIRKMFPWVTDTDLHQIHEELMKSHLADTSTWRFEIRTDIHNVYTSPYGDDVAFATTGDHKELNCSCMRHDFNMPYHPVEAYETHDFEIHTVWNGDDELMARAVVYRGNNTRGPIYACHPAALTMFEENSTATRAGSGDWDGAALHYNEAYAPYLDVGAKGYDWTPGEDMMTITSDYERANVSCSCHDEEQNVRVSNCRHCHTDMHPADGRYCASCATDLVPCAHTGDLIHPEHHMTVQLDDGRYMHKDYVDA